MKEVRMAHATAEEQVAALLDEAGETHHRVYRITEGTDDDWASWYADWLLRLSELPQVLGTAPVRSELVWLLVGLDKEYSSIETEEPWPSFYARRGRVRDPRRAVPHDAAAGGGDDGAQPGRRRGGRAGDVARRR